MGFFNALKRLLPHTSAPGEPVSEEARQRIRAAWGLDEEENEGAARDEAAAAGDGRARSSETVPEVNASRFDRSLWEKRLRTILDGLPGTESQWQALLTDAHALQLDPEWIADRQRQGFAFLVRRAVADRVISEADHHKLDLARKLIGLSEAEAEAAVHAILTEAEVFFGSPVKDEA